MCEHLWNFVYNIYEFSFYKSMQFIFKNLYQFSFKIDEILWRALMKWKGINHKQSTRWQHLSQLKASAYFSLQNCLVVMKHSNLYLGLVLPSGRWQCLIEFLKTGQNWVLKMGEINFFNGLNEVFKMNEILFNINKI